MKLCVLNYSGNVGKSTIAKHLLGPPLDDCEMVKVESINADEDDNEAIRGRRFRELSEMLDMFNSAVVDVGSSNVEGNYSPLISISIQPEPCSPGNSERSAMSA